MTEDEWEAERAAPENLLRARGGRGSTPRLRPLAPAGDPGAAGKGGWIGLVMATAAKTVYSHITKDPEVCGRRACIDRTRIRVVDIACRQREGYTPERMLEAYRSLNLAQIQAALSYYYENPQEIEDALKEDREVAEEIERDRDDFLRKHSAP